MTMKNIPIVIGFGIITSSQLVIGVIWTIIAIREGGEANPLGYRNRPHS